MLEKTYWAAAVTLTLVSCLGCDSPKADESSSGQSERAKEARPTEPAPRPKWYLGGTLHKANGLEWRAGTSEDKLATAADMLAALWQKGALAENVAQKVQTVDDLKGPARELVIGLDEAFDLDVTDDKLKATLEAQDVSSTSVLLLTMMGWIKK